MITIKFIVTSNISFQITDIDPEEQINAKIPQIIETMNSGLNGDERYESVKLIYCGRIIKDLTQTWNDHNIKDNCTVHVHGKKVEAIPPIPPVSDQQNLPNRVQNFSLASGTTPAAQLIFSTSSSASATSRPAHVPLILNETIANFFGRMFAGNESTEFEPAPGTDFSLNAMAGSIFGTNANPNIPSATHATSNASSAEQTYSISQVQRSLGNIIKVVQNDPDMYWNVMKNTGSDDVREKLIELLNAAPVNPVRNQQNLLNISQNFSLVPITSEQVTLRVDSNPTNNESQNDTTNGNNENDENDVNDEHQEEHNDSSDSDENENDTTREHADHNLTAQDIANINQLVEITNGSKETCTRVYLRCGKDANLAASILLAS